MYDLMKYFERVRHFVTSNYLTCDVVYSGKEYPFEIITNKDKEVIGMEIKEKDIILKNGDKISIEESCNLDRGNIRILAHKYHYSPESPDKNEGRWYYRVDLDDKNGLHGNHDDGKDNYYKNEWPHHLKPDVDIDLNIEHFNFYLFLKLTSTYISQQTRYPFEKCHASYYNEKIGQWKKEII